MAVSAELDDLGLAENDLADRLADLGSRAGHLVEFGDDVFFCFVDACHGAHYSLRAPDSA